MWTLGVDTSNTGMASFPDPGNGKVICSLAGSLAIHLYLLLRSESVKGRKSTLYREEKWTRSCMPNAFCASGRKVLIYSAVR